jgi:anti-anti-sigma factor
MIEIELTAPNRVTLSGRFDASQVEQVSAVFAQLEGDSVIDMEGLRYISSAGISALLILFKRLDAQGSQCVRVCGTRSAVSDGLAVLRRSVVDRMTRPTESEFAFA